MIIKIETTGPSVGSYPAANISLKKIDNIENTVSSVRSYPSANISFLNINNIDKDKTTGSSIGLSKGENFSILK